MISVCMATYNGEKYVKNQLSSILSQIGENDEIIIIDDLSSDDTCFVIENLGDSRIKLYKNASNIGIIRSFERAILLSLGDYIFLSDQDDVWLSHKVSTFMKHFTLSPNTLVVLSNCIVVDDSNSMIFSSYFDMRGSKPGLVKNILKNSYVGCNMAFTKEMKNYILPIPTNVSMHDQWIGLIGEVLRRTIFVKDILLEWRRHENTHTSFRRNPIPKMIKSRLTLVHNLLVRSIKIKNKSK